MMEKSEQSTNSQRANELRALRDLATTALIFVITIATLIAIGITVEQDAKNLEARCKSLGGVVGQTKCFKGGKEI
mgnify:CR=1 FL=1|nr:MAG TPA: hypothetical protein [Caudoviricetes sp.]